MRQKPSIFCLPWRDRVRRGLSGHSQTLWTCCAERKWNCSFPYGRCEAGIIRPRFLNPPAVFSDVFSEKRDTGIEIISWLKWQELIPLSLLHSTISRIIHLSRLSHTDLLQMVWIIPRAPWLSSLSLWRVRHFKTSSLNSLTVYTSPLGPFALTGIIPRPLVTTIHKLILIIHHN